MCENLGIRVIVYLICRDGVWLEKVGKWSVYDMMPGCKTKLNTTEIFQSFIILWLRSERWCNLVTWDYQMWLKIDFGVSPDVIYLSFSYESENFFNWKDSLLYFYVLNCSSDNILISFTAIHLLVSCSFIPLLSHTLTYMAHIYFDPHLCHFVRVQINE